MRKQLIVLVAGLALVTGSVIQAIPASAAPIKSNAAVRMLSNEQAAAIKFQGVSIGLNEDQLIKLVGEPSRKDSSEYGFEWYIYNKDYERYLQVGVRNHKVVALYTNAKEWKAGGVGFGSTKNEITAVFGPALNQIKKGNTIYQYKDNGGKYSLHKVGSLYATVFYDTKLQSKASSIQLIQQETELAFQGYYGTPSESLRSSFEQEVFDLTNTMRVRHGKKPLQWNDQIATTARKHSADMGKRNFFNHSNPDGETPFDRMKEDGVAYKQAGENIAAGQTSAIFAHENWMNSEGHRNNILGDFTRLGVGVSFGGSYKVYYTQNFYTPSL
ncbi:CAP domain-containing protein [Paenibacillus sp. UMB4589-SE434]|uniref:CAP domain-containing protein n=1 Tax=Paenibacillus sp. UMB4589-SE434 TaxID=3046314 RepID=UPI00254DD1A1|nr:CAP domain-containing protein [Paenibacillus sp. UMB4589-SE434]MDK8183525.1 CAP domain-containing protein [Paenibacillus sp. UMB4589-SE434]